MVEILVDLMVGKKDKRMVLILVDWKVVMMAVLKVVRKVEMMVV